MNVDPQLPRISIEDLEWFVNVRNSVSGNLHDPREFSVEQAREWISESNPDFRIISVDGHRAGYFRLSIDDADPTCLWVGADLSPEFQGKGIARAAYQTFLTVLAQEYSASTIRLRVLPTNVRAIRLYLSLGFRTTHLDFDDAPDGRSLILIDCTMERPTDARLVAPPAQDPMYLIIGRV